MSEHDRSAFFGDQHTIGEYFDALSPQQQSQLSQFYDEQCSPGYENRHVTHDTDRLRQHITYGRTPHGLFVAARWALDAHQESDDYRLVTCRRQAEVMQTERYEILDIRHAKRPGDAMLNRIISAKGETTSRLITLKLGSAVTWTETIITNEGHEHHIPLPVEHFVLPQHLLAPRSSHQ